MSSVVHRLESAMLAVIGIPVSSLCDEYGSGSMMGRGVDGCCSELASSCVSATSFSLKGGDWTLLVLLQAKLSEVSSGSVSVLGVLSSLFSAWSLVSPSFVSVPCSSVIPSLSVAQLVPCSPQRAVWVDRYLFGWFYLCKTNLKQQQ
jgi:hypothetical protein